MILTIGYNQLIILATTIVGYFLRTSVLTDTLSDIKNRFNFVKKLKFESKKDTQQRKQNEIQHENKNNNV